MDILIIEDDILSAYKLMHIIESQNWNIIGYVKTINESKIFLNHTIPDLVISDIMLGQENIFDLFQNDIYKKIPFVFVTSSEEEIYFEKSKELFSSGLLIKPFHRLSVLSSIEQVMKNYKRMLPKCPLTIIVNGKANEKIKLKQTEVSQVIVEGNYSMIKTLNKTYALKVSLQNIIKTLGPEFVQINRMTLVNIEFLISIDTINKRITNNFGTFPVGKKYFENLQNQINISNKLLD
jgi:two-component system, LytTR family, response regulator LytT